MTDESRLVALEEDLGVQLSRYGLWALGSLHAVSAFVGGPALGVSVIAYGGYDTSVTSVVGAVVAITVVVLGFGLGLLHFVAAWGLMGGTAGLGSPPSFCPAWRHFSAASPPPGCSCGACSTIERAASLTTQNKSDL